MNNKAFISELSERSGYSQVDTQKLLLALFAKMGEAFEEGNGVLIQNFGAFDVKKRLERVVTNPATQQKMLVPPKLILGFKPSSTLKGKLKNGGSEDE